MPGISNTGSFPSGANTFTPWSVFYRSSIQWLIEKFLLGRFFLLYWYLQFLCLRGKPDGPNVLEDESTNDLPLNSNTFPPTSTSWISSINFPVEKRHLLDSLIVPESGSGDVIARNSYTHSPELSSIWTSVHRFMFSNVFRSQILMFFSCLENFIGETAGKDDFSSNSTTSLPTRADCVFPITF